MFRYVMTVASAFALVIAPTVALAAPKEPVKVTTAKAFKGTQSVVIGSFNIAFINEKTDSAFAGRRGYGGSSVAKTHLEGVTPDQFQAITDAAYADFMTQMTAAGYTIVDRANYVAMPDIAKQKFVGAGAQGTVVFGKDSKAKALYYAPSAFGSMGILAGEIGGGMFAGFGAMGPAMARGKYAMANKQTVMNVRYVVDYANADHYGGFFRLSSSVKLTAQLAIVETLSTVTVTDTRGMLGTLTLAQPVAVQGDFGDLNNTTTGGQKLENAVGNVIGFLGGIGTSSRKYFTFTADPVPYRDGAIDAAARTNSQMIGKLVALR